MKAEIGVNVTLSQAKPTVTRTQKRQGTDSPLEAPEQVWCCDTDRAHLTSRTVRE